MSNEADTRAKLIDPALHATGWTEDKIIRDRFITPGRSIDENGKRLRGKKPDYILLYEQSFPIAIAEAKEEGKSALKGVQQAEDYFGSAVHLGMTATPKRSDNIDTYAYFGEPVYSYSMGQAIEDGFLAPFQIFRSFTNIDREGLHIQDALYQGAQVYVPEEADLKEVYTLEDFEREIVLPDRTEKICEHLANLFKTFGALQKTIVFCVNMEHAAQVAKELQNRFAHLGYSVIFQEPSLERHFQKFSQINNTMLNYAKEGVKRGHQRTSLFSPKHAYNIFC